MITVRLYGDLQQYGRRFDLNAETPAEALHALFTQLRGLKKQVSDGLYQVRWKRQDLSEETAPESLHRADDGVLHVVPRVAGAGKVGQLIVGGALIALSFWNPLVGIIGKTAATAMLSVGIGMTLGGVAQLLTKMPNMNAGSGAESSKNTAFSNLDNTAAQGQPMPLAYGLCYAGSRVISQGVESRRVSADGKTASNGGSDFSRILAAAAGRSDVTAPLALDLTLSLNKVFTAGVAATAPNGQKYNTDFTNDSVRACNYTAEYSAN